MAALVKNDAHRLYVVYLPSIHESAWRSAFTEIALKAGWAVIDDFAQGQYAASVHGNVLINGSSPDRTETWNPTQVLMIVDTPGGTIESLLAEHPYGDAVRYASRSLASASAFIESHPTVAVSAVSSVIVADGLGEVSLDKRASASDVVAGPLAIYEHLPPKAGSSALWPQSVFIVNPSTHDDLVDGLNTDLTGRRRILQHGPYVTVTPGVWEVTVKFALAVNSSAIDLRFEWGTEHDAEVSSHSIKTSGVYQVTLSKRWDQCSMVELRIWLDRALFDGGFEVELCTVRFVGAEPSIAIEDQPTALSASLTR